VAPLTALVRGFERWLGHRRRLTASTCGAGRLARRGHSRIKGLRTTVGSPSSALSARKVERRAPRHRLWRVDGPPTAPQKAQKISGSGCGAADPSRQDGSEASHASIFESAPGPPEGKTGTKRERGALERFRPASSFFCVAPHPCFSYLFLLYLISSSSKGACRLWKGAFFSTTTRSCLTLDTVRRCAFVLSPRTEQSAAETWICG